MIGLLVCLLIALVIVGLVHLEYKYPRYVISDLLARWKR